MRALHWALVATLGAAWWTGGSTGWVHEVLGYAAGAIVAARLVHGFTGGRYARFAQFVHAPRATQAYLRAVIAGRAPRHLGHNPLGGWMVVALLACAAALSLTGWLYVTDWLWGYAWLYELHAGLAWGFVGLVALHLAGVASTGWKHRENLVAAMLTGRKRAPRGDDVA